MKKFLSIVLSVLCVISVFMLAACNNGGDNPTPSDYTRPSNPNIDETFTASSNILVAYFSKTSTTKGVADKIQEYTNADIFEIERKEAYPNEYTPTTEEAKEEKEANARPELAAYLPDEVFAEYDTIILGFPIWWHTAPMAVLSFLNYYDFSGKTIYTFCTSGGSSITESTTDIRNNADNATVIEGKRFSGSSDSSINTWLNEHDLITESNTPVTPEVPDNPNIPNTPEVPDNPTNPIIPDDPNKPNEPTDTSSILIVYFSWTSSGNTRTMTNYIANKTGGTVVEILAAVPYTGSYNDVAYGRAKEEWENNARPAVSDVTYNQIDMSEYDTVFVGFPIWWHTAPMIIGTFLEHYTWSADIDIYPYFQGASNSNNEYYNNSMEFIRNSAKGATVHDGLYASQSNTTKIDEYLQANGFIN